MIRTTYLLASERVLSISNHRKPCSSIIINEGYVMPCHVMLILGSCDGKSEDTNDMNKIGKQRSYAHTYKDS